MKKILIVLFILFSAGCSNKLEHYQDFSNTVIGFYQEPYYDTEKFNMKENELLQNYLSTLTGIDLVIDLEQYMNKDKDYYTNEKNTDGVFIENGKCYIKYDDLEFRSIDPEDPALENKYTKVVCNNYFVILFEEQFADYEDILNDQKYNYRYLGYVKNKNIYEFIYRSYYTGSGLVVEIHIEDDEIIDFEVIEKQISDYIFTEEEIPVFGVALLILIMATIIFITVYILKQVRK